MRVLAIDGRARLPARLPDCRLFGGYAHAGTDLGGALAPIDDPAEQQHPEEKDERTDPGNRFGLGVPGVDEAYSNDERDGSDDPDAHLQQRGSRPFEPRMEAVVDSEQEKRHPSQQIEMSVGLHTGMIFRDRHHDAPGYADERGLAGAEELKAGHALTLGKPLERKLTTDLLHQALIRPSFHREPSGPARFEPGDRVRTRNIHPPTHTRLPRYARGKIGAVERCHGCQIFPDSVAINLGDDPQWLYTVVFEGRELWGADADPTVKVSIDAFEPYLDPA